MYWACINCGKRVRSSSELKCHIVKCCVWLYWWPWKISWNNALSDVQSPSEYIMLTVWWSSWSSTLLKQRSIMIIERQILPQLLTGWGYRYAFCIWYWRTYQPLWQVDKFCLWYWADAQTDNISTESMWSTVYLIIYLSEDISKATGCSADAVQILTQHLIVRQVLLFLNWATNSRIETTFLFTTVLTTAERCGFTITTLQRKVWMSSLRTHNWTRCTVIWVSRTQINDLMTAWDFIWHQSSIKEAEMNLTDL
jgi:hypothetical protein